MQDEVAVNENNPPELPVSDAMQSYRDGWALANAYAKSAFTPEAFRGRPENVMVAMHITAQTGVSIFQVMNNMFINQSGKVGFEAKFMISMANRFGPFKDHIDWETDRQKDGNIWVRAYAEMKSTGKVVEAVISLNDAKKAGWHRNSKGEKPVWLSQPVQMLRYKSASMLIRLYCPEVLFGMKTEVDYQLMDEEKSGSGNTAIDAMNEKLEDSENAKL